MVIFRSGVTLRVKSGALTPAFKIAAIESSSVGCANEE
jgi:hypothetical protein